MIAVLTGIICLLILICFILAFVLFIVLLDLPDVDVIQTEGQLDRMSDEPVGGIDKRA